jgi:histidinol-phosphatase (PHP family)
MESPSYGGRLSEIARAAGRSGLVVEINTGGLNRGRTRDTYPSRAFLRLLRENQVPILISADAHRAEDIAGHYDTARLIMLEAGYTGHVLFQGRKNGRPLWRSEQFVALT